MGELGELLTIAPSTLHQEVEHLMRAGVIADRHIGRNRLLRVNADIRLVPASTTLMTLSFGPQVVVAEEFAGIPGAGEVIVYGSWAQRYEGTETEVGSAI